jgi:hypothetical protein
MTTTIIIAIIVIALILYWKSKPIKNSHKIPQEVDLIEFNNSNNNPKFEGIQKGHKLKLSRELGHPGYNLYVTFDTNGKNLSKLKKIIFSWSDWKERIFDFNYSRSDKNVEIDGDKIKIDVGSFNNCSGSKNFLNRTAASQLLKIDLLDYEPEYGDFEYEKDFRTQSIFCPFLTRKELMQFKKGLHYTDS